MSHHHAGHSKRGSAFFLLTLLAMAFMIAAFATPLYYAKYQDNGQTNEQYSDIWYSCTREYSGDKPPYECIDTADPQLGCQEAKDRMRAIRAFYVLTSLFVVLNLVAGAVEHRGVKGIGGRIALIVLSIVVIVMSALSWSIAVSYPRERLCDNDKLVDLPNYEWGASPFLMVAISCIGILQLILSIILPGI